MFEKIHGGISGRLYEADPVKNTNARIIGRNHARNSGGILDELLGYILLGVANVIQDGPLDKLLKELPQELVMKYLYFLKESLEQFLIKPL